MHAPEDTRTSATSIDCLANRPPRDPSDSVLPRRSLFALGSALAATMLGPLASNSPAQVVATPPVDLDPDPLLRLVRRVTMGINEAEVARARALGYNAYLEYQLNHTAIDDSENEEFLHSYLPVLTYSPKLIYERLFFSQISGQLTEATILRSIFSRRQLYQRMVEFWTDHFSINITKAPPCDRLKAVDDREAIRPYALSTFPALLSASAHSPAMLGFLDNDASTALAVNENYGREIMELHTLGVDGGYTQNDVVEVAKCFSGWAYDDYSGNNLNSGRFRFFPERHVPGPKRVLGHDITSGGINDGLAVLDILAHHPSTATFIATKLCRWLLGTPISDTAVARVSAVYRSTGGDIRAMIREALSFDLLSAAPLRFKRPYHVFISAMRSLPTTITTTSSLRNLLDTAGHRPFYWTTPDGYPDSIDYWGGYLVPRWNFGADLMSNRISGVRVNVAAFAAGESRPAFLVDKINRALFGGEMTLVDRNVLARYLGPAPVATQTLAEAIGLAIAAPAFQWY